MQKNLSVIISNRNDVKMLVVTIRSCIEALKPLGLENCEVVVCDNSDKPIYAKVQSAIPHGYCREGILSLYRQEEPCLFSARGTAAEKAKGKYILCLDSHMIVGHNCFVDLYNFMEKHSYDEKIGFAHAPINWAHHHERQSKHDRDLTKNELGPWGLAYDEERKITWKGMPWICRRDWFLDTERGLGGYGALAKKRISWGGGDMHIGTKAWLLGFENWAVPTSPCIHIGPFPKTDSIPGDINSTHVSPKGDDEEKYRLYGKSGNYPHTFGFLVSCFVLGGEPMMLRNKPAIQERFGRYLDIDKYWREAIAVGLEERAWLEEHQIMTFEQFIAQKPWNGTPPKPIRTHQIKEALSSQVKVKRMKCSEEKIYDIYLKLTNNDRRYLRPRRWNTIRTVLESQKLTKILEFGSGVSTLLFDNLDCTVDSYETDEKFLNLVKDNCSEGVKFHFWDNKTAPDLDHYNLALVDGALPRTLQLELAIKHADFVAIDDCVGKYKQAILNRMKDFKRLDNDKTYMTVFKVN